jgi:hypothetical protein
VINTVAKAKAAKQLKQEEEDLDDLLGYLAASILAVGLTLSCPGHTDLWISVTKATTTTIATDSEPTSSLNWWLLFRAVLSYAVTIVVYLRLQGSDPGYLTAVMLNELGDGYNARGSDKQKETDEDEDAAHNMQARKEMRISNTASSPST